MRIKAYIDGQEGTTGLQIKDRLTKHPDVELIEIAPALRKDTEERKKKINAADVVFLCLPDAAAIEAVTLVENPNTCVIDASTAHRIADDWAYGFAELSKAHRAAIALSKRIANPGCHATGFIAAVYPLIALGIAPKGYPFSCHSITGYSGGGKKMIAQYETEDRSVALDSPRQYGLTLQHKHLPEMQKLTGIAHSPIFNPIVSDFYCGMAVSVPLDLRFMDRKLDRQQMQNALHAYYAEETLVNVYGIPEDGFLSANEKSNLAGLDLFVLGNDEQITLVSVFDNLGKGASGAAVQNMNIAFGIDETKSLL